MKKCVILFIAFINIICLSSPFIAESNKVKDPDTELFLRLHIRANSDSEQDQDLKLKVRDSILKYTTTLLKDIESKSEAMSIIEKDLEEITAKAKEITENEGYSYKIKTELKKEFFEKKEYDGFFLPADIYDSLIIEIGEGKGHNWWCVIFPAVCVSGALDVKKTGEESAAVMNTELIPEKYQLHLAENPIPQKVKYEFWIVKFIKSIVNLFDK